MEESAGHVAFRFWSLPFSSDTIRLDSGKEYKLYNLPYYYAGQLEKVLENVITL